MEKQRCAIVSGAARGIGFAIARRLELKGHRILALDVRGDALAEAVALLHSEGIEADPLVIDLEDGSALRSIPNKVGERFNQVGVLVNNAGISPKRDGQKIPIAEMPQDEWEQVFRVNLTAPFLLAQLVIPPMKARGWGRIVNISSMAARMPAPAAGVHYTASKSGLIGLTKALARDLAGDGITANAIAPGAVTGVMNEGNSEMQQKAILASIPMGRLAGTAEIADAVAFLASDQAAYITGVTLDINGGRLMV